MDIRKAAALFAAVVSAAADGAYDIGSDFADRDKWTADPVEFNIDHKGAGFRFVDQKRECSVAMGEGLVEYKGVPVAETRVYFGDGKVKRIEMSVYNKGDLAPIGKDTFLGLVEMLRKRLNPEGARLPDAAKETLASGMYRRVQRWDKTFPAAELAWAWREDRAGGKREIGPEYVRLTLVGAEDASAARKEMASSKQQTAKGARKIKENVQKNVNGDVFISGVPMVNQGQKGYCAAATSERVMRYYGIDMDEHEIAQLAGTSASGGTESGAMVDAVTRVASKVGLRKEEIVRGAGGGEWEKSDIYKTLQLYNQAAKAAKEPTIDWQRYRSGNSINAGKIMSDMKAKLLKTARMKLSGQQKRFRDEIRKQVNQGVPIFWSVILGLYPEPEIPQASGGHMRLIIGYNDKTKEVLYTDSWGAGHELKRMPEDWAWTITTSSMFIKPRQ